MGVQKEYKDYKIVRNSWWRFWQIDQLEFILPTRYEDAYEEVTKRILNGNSWSMELSSWVIEDVRRQLMSRVSTYSKVVAKAKRLSVTFHTREGSQYYIDGMDFYIINGEIYFDSDESMKRDKLLSSLGL